MRYRNKNKVDFSNNPLKKDPALLSKKNELEARWYDREAESYFTQLDNARGPLAMDLRYERNVGPYYDNLSLDYPHDRNFFLFRSIPRNSGQKMLDLGCGNGILSRFFLRRGMEVVSLDISQRICEFMLHSDPNCVVVRSCAECLPFAHDTFDVVMSLTSLHHFNLRLSLQEIMRVLKPGGTGVFMEPLLNSKVIYKIRQFIPVDDTESPGGGGIDASELKTELDNAGFDYKVTEYELITRLERLPGLEPHQDRLRKMDHFLLTKVPFLRRFARLAVIVMRKG